MLSYIKDLSEHMAWADSKIWTEVMKISKHSNIKDIFDLLFHLHSVQHAYLCIWTNQQLDQFENIKFDNLDDLSNWRLDFHKKNERFISGMDEEKLTQPVNIPWTKYLEKKIGKKPDTSNLIQTILQVIMHSTYHRAQINTKIREVRGEPPMTDYIFWVWIGKPKLNQ